MKLTLTYVNRKDMTSSKGKPFTSLSIKATEYGDRYLSGFGGSTNKEWKVGDVVEVADVKEVKKDDKTYLNFEMAKSSNNAPLEVMKILNELATRVGSLNVKVERIIDHLSNKNRLDLNSDGTEQPDFDPED